MGAPGDRPMAVSQQDAPSDSMCSDACRSLLPPYDTTIHDVSWKNYYEERAALDELNKIESTEARKLISTEVSGQQSITLLRQARKDIVRVLRGAALWDGAREEYPRSASGGLYYTSLSSISQTGAPLVMIPFSASIQMAAKLIQARI